MGDILNLVSMARKAGKLEVGEEPTVAAARAHQAKLILVAQDATENTYRRVRHAGANGNVTWVSTPYTKAQLGQAIGRGAVAMVAVMDIGLAASMIRGLAAQDPEKYSIPLERLTNKNEKAQKRLQEKRQHEKNIKTGKYQAKQRTKEAAEAAQAAVPEQPRESVAPTPRKPERRPQDKPRGRNFRPGSGRNSSSGKKHRGRSNPFEHFDTERPRRGGKKEK